MVILKLQKLVQAMKKELSANEKSKLIEILKARFEKNIKRHSGIKWNLVEKKLLNSPNKLWSLNQMEKSGGEPDVIAFDEKENTFLFCDCSSESPLGRRSLCYDQSALDKRKNNKPKGNVIEDAKQMGVEVLTESEYQHLQKLESFDAKSSSWVITPDSIRRLGGAIFCDYRYGTVFTYHNGADSYYAARGYRSKLWV